MSLVPTSSQTVGPFFNFGLTADPRLGILVHKGVPGEHIELQFRVTDGKGEPTPGDSMIELWQADSQGLYPSADGTRPAFYGFGRLETSKNGECAFQTIKPGPIASPNGQHEAPHINVIVFARGLLKHLYTRVYFEGDAANDSDPVLALVPPVRRYTLLAKPVAGIPATWRMEIRLQGDDETVFFDL